MEDWKDVFRSEMRWSSKSQEPCYAASTEKASDENQSAHRSLIPQREEFRLVILHPSPDYSSPIECSLKHAAFKENVPYEALSYVWGDQSKPKSVTLDGMKQKITINLEEALLHLRKPSEARTLWIDALCINQNDITERNQQVALMKQIYTSCTIDLVWLGRSNEDLERGFEIAGKLEHGHLFKSRDPSRLDQFHLKKLRQQEWRSLAMVFVDLDVWNRVWVMQEISCAPRVVLILGRKTLDWEILAGFLGRNNHSDAFHSAFHHTLYERDAVSTFSGIQVIEHQRDIVRSMRNGYTSKLLDVLARFRYTRATDPRDKIYGLLGLASDTMGVGVDYSKSVRDVFVDIFRAYTDTTQNLDLLCQSQWGVSDVSISGERLPSWCPDFSRPGETVLLFAQRSIFGAGKQHCHIPCSVDTGYQLKLEGIRLGAVSSLYSPSSVHQSRSNESAAFGIMAELVLKGEPYDIRNTYEPTGENTSQAFWRTILADCKIHPTKRLDASDIDVIGGYIDYFQEWEENRQGYRLSNNANDAMMWKMMQDWKFALNEYGFYCMIPKSSQLGDMIVVLDGGKVPLVVRPIAKNPTGGSAEQCYKVVGTAYVHGFMDGQAMKWEEEGKLESGSFCLV
ncbi:heterokaryon incompatibility protein [Phlyctema vagabunda]|uniref:Heterokaryon incompatibility protein n=1 Tax=Phlyctema vagabunda TaxID=108571 RepID=A0ABR4PHP8_9HELO